MTPGIAKRSQEQGQVTRRQPDGPFFWVGFTLLIAAVIVGGLRIYNDNQGPNQAPTSLVDFIQHEMTMTRLLVGTLTILVAPLLLNILLWIFGIKPRCTTRRIVCVAVIPPTLAYVFSWFSPTLFLPVLFLSGLIAWLLLKQGLALSPLKSTGLWVTQGLALLLLANMTIYSVESILVGEVLNPVQEWPAIHASVKSNDGHPQPLGVATTSLPVFQWKSSGSRWLDLRGNRVQIDLQTSHPLRREISIVEANTGTRVVSGQVYDTTWHSDVFVPKVDRVYRVHIKEGVDVDDVVTIQSLLPATFDGNSDDRSDTVISIENPVGNPPDPLSP